MDISFNSAFAFSTKVPLIEKDYYDMMSYIGFVYYPHLVYHSDNHTRVFYNSVAMMLDVLEELGADLWIYQFKNNGLESSTSLSTDSASMEMRQNEWKNFKYTLLFGSIFHDFCFDLKATEKGIIPDPENELNSYLSAKLHFEKFLLATCMEVNDTLLKALILHTKVSFNPSSMIVESPTYSADPVTSLGQLIFEIADKGHCFDPRGMLFQNVNGNFKLGFEDNLRLYFEMQLRSDPEFHFVDKICMGFVNGPHDYVKVFDHLMNQMISFWQLSLINHISEKVKMNHFLNTILCVKSNFMSTFVNQHLQLIDQAQAALNWSDEDKIQMFEVARKAITDDFHHANFYTHI